MSVIFNDHKGVKTHGLSHKPEYKAWVHMRHRCYNPNHKQFKDYGGRQITICDEWIDNFLQFYADMGDRPGPEYTLERINNDAGYSPSNCKWATRREQGRNRRDTIKIPLCDLAEMFGLTYQTIHSRLADGWDLKTALTQPIRPQRQRRPYDAFGRSQSLNDWSAETGVNLSTIYTRIYRGLSLEEALLPGVRTTRTSPTGRLLTVGGVTKSIRAWSLSNGVPGTTIRKRLKRGWSEADAVLPPGSRRS